MTAAIRVENLGKSYRVNHAEEKLPYKTLRDSLVRVATAPVRRWRAGGHYGVVEDFWALKDVNFDIQPGEVVGIIGRNGAGKSTLLKILSRITPPSTGRVQITGRVGSLLEVGTGFHPELTGRENIFMNGSILGMSRAEIKRKFDEIVDFSGVEKFLDTPVKRYSSGMQVRLAFAVAANLDPEALLIDEVLAVGDASFQRRCVDKMLELAHSGRTILIVSHNLDLVERLCPRSFLLESGQVVASGESDQIIGEYLSSRRDEGGTDLSGRRRLGDGRARFVSIRHVDSFGFDKQFHESGDDLIFHMAIDSTANIPDVELAIVISSLQGTRIVTSLTSELGLKIGLTPGRQEFDCTFKNVRLRPGRSMTVQFWLAEHHHEIDCLQDALLIDVIHGSGSESFSANAAQGAVIVDYHWSRRRPGVPQPVDRAVSADSK